MTTTATLVPDRDDIASMPFMWDPQDQYIGALLHLPAATAAHWVALVPAEAIHHPTARWSYELIGGLIDAGHDPDPTLVLAQARKASGHPERVKPVSDLGNYLVNVYTSTHNTTSVGHYAAEVLDEAFRRATEAWGHKLVNLAESYADRQEITHAVTDLMRGQLRELWQRAEQARALVRQGR